MYVHGDVGESSRITAKTPLARACLAQASIISPLSFRSPFVDTMTLVTQSSLPQAQCLWPEPPHAGLCTIGSCASTFGQRIKSTTFGHWSVAIAALLCDWNSVSGDFQFRDQLHTSSACHVARGVQRHRFGWSHTFFSSPLSPRLCKYTVVTHASECFTKYMLHKHKSVSILGHIGTNAIDKPACHRRFPIGRHGSMLAHSLMLKTGPNITSTSRAYTIR